MGKCLGYKIKKIREFKNISQHYVATHLGVSQAAYSRIENNTLKIDENKLMKIATALNIEIDIIKNFNEQSVLNRCSYSDNCSPFEKLKEYEKLLIEKNTRIKMLEEMLNKESNNLSSPCTPA